MKDIILILCVDPDLRRLYHELLSRRNIEVDEARSVEDALARQVTTTYTRIMIYADDLPFEELRLYFYVQRRVKRFIDAQVCLITSEPDQFKAFGGSKNSICDHSQLNPLQLIEKVLE